MRLVHRQGDAINVAKITFMALQRSNGPHTGRTRDLILGERDAIISTITKHNALYIYEQPDRAVQTEVLPLNYYKQIWKLEYRGLHFYPI